MNVISARVVEYRKKKGLTQEQLAKELNISRGILSLVESGERTPSKEMAKRLAVYFRVPVDVFLFEDLKNPELGKQTVSTAEILKLAELVQEYYQKHGRTLTDEQKVFLVDYFYQKNITDSDRIKDALSFMQAAQSKLAL